MGGVGVVLPRNAKRAISKRAMAPHATYCAMWRMLTSAELFIIKAAIPAATATKTTIQYAGGRFPIMPFFCARFLGKVTSTIRLKQVAKKEALSNKRAPLQKTLPNQHYRFCPEPPPPAAAGTPS